MFKQLSSKHENMLGNTCRQLPTVLLPYATPAHFLLRLTNELSTCQRRKQIEHNTLKNPSNVLHEVFFSHPFSPTLFTSYFSSFSPNINIDPKPHLSAADAMASSLDSQRCSTAKAQTRFASACGGTRSAAAAALAMDSWSRWEGAGEQA